MTLKLQLIAMYETGCDSPEAFRRVDPVERRQAMNVEAARYLARRDPRWPV